MVESLKVRYALEGRKSVETERASLRMTRDLTECKTLP